MQGREGGTNPLWNGNKLKLGVFATNVSRGACVTTAPEAYQLSWPNTLAIAQMADRLGLEAYIPVARWRGFGGPSNFNGESFETYTWAAGLAQGTEHLSIFTTSHVPTVHPIMAAKQAVTVDHISNGRFALNIVCGWFQPELEMFGAPIMEHDIRYEYAAEWIEIMKLLWTREEEFDFDGKYLRVKGGYSRPKPIQKPFPPLMNAGASGKGRDFGAKYADIVFTSIDPNDMERSRAHLNSYRKLARDEYGRDIQIWCGASVTQRATLAEAEELVRYYVMDKGDDEAVDNLLRIQNREMHRLLPQDQVKLRARVKEGWGGYQLHGPAERIVDGLSKLSAIGIDGVVLHWLDYQDGLARWPEVMRGLEQAGLREPSSGSSARKGRIPGLLRGQIHIADDFDEPLPDNFFPASPKA